MPKMQINKDFQKGIAI